MLLHTSTQRTGYDELLQRSTERQNSCGTHEEIRSCLSGRRQELALSHILFLDKFLLVHVEWRGFLICSWSFSSLFFFFFLSTPLSVHFQCPRMTALVALFVALFALSTGLELLKPPMCGTSDGLCIPMATLLTSNPEGCLLFDATYARPESALDEAGELAFNQQYLADCQAALNNDPCCDAIAGESTNNAGRSPLKRAEFQCSTAEVTPSIPFDISDSNFGAGFFRRISWPLTCTAFASRNVFYSFTPTVSGPVTLSVEASFNPILAIYSSCSADALTCNDNYNGLGSQITATLTANTPYIIAIASATGARGPYTLSGRPAIPTQVSSRALGVPFVFPPPDFAIWFQTTNTAQQTLYITDIESYVRSGSGSAQCFNLLSSASPPPALPGTYSLASTSSCNTNSNNLDNYSRIAIVLTFFI